MSTRIELPDGNWAEIRDPAQVSERRRRAYMAAMAAVGVPTGDLPMDGQGRVDPSKVTPEQLATAFKPEQMALLGIAYDTLIVALVEAWSFSVPIDVDSVLDLPGKRTYDVLLKACSAEAGGMLPDYSVSPDPKAPGGASPASPTG